jgi:sulfonate transport system substrate-binding protein
MNEGDQGILNLKIGGVPEHFNLLWELPEVKEIFTQKRLSVDFYEFPGGTGALSEAVKSGFLDGAVILTEGAVTEITRGCNYRIVCPFVQSPLFWGIFASARSSVHDLSDLSSRIFAISRFNSGSHLMAQYLAGLQGERLSIRNFYPASDLEGARKALASGKAHLFLWEKFMTNPLVKSGEFRQVGELKAPWNSFVLVMREDIIIGHRALANRIKQAVIESGVWFKKMENAPIRISEKYGIDIADARIWFDEVLYFKDEPFEPALQKTAEILFRYQISDRMANVSDLIFHDDAS